MTILLAEASNQFAGQWMYVLIAVVNGAVGVVAIFSLFATRREVDKIDERVGAIEKLSREDKEELIAAGERRSYVLHNRINPLVENTAAIKANQEAFTKSFDNFSEVMRSFADAIKQQTEVLRSVAEHNNRHGGTN